MAVILAVLAGHVATCPYATCPYDVPAEYWAPTGARAVSGEASYYAPGVMAAVARRRGISLDGYLGGVAMMRAGNLGREVWVSLTPNPSPRGRGEEWVGPFVVVDCAQRAHFEGLVARQRVIEFDRGVWRWLGLPDAPVPVVVSFGGPGMDAPAVRWQ